ncbi:unnamed protein product [Amoebophrya sp. A25]|nr:unnamed protein product [Amoebophrya sp. A25]|eukprot:GSA25T00022602001.1
MVARDRTHRQYPTHRQYLNRQVGATLRPAGRIMRAARPIMAAPTGKASPSSEEIVAICSGDSLCARGGSAENSRDAETKSNRNDKSGAQGQQSRVRGAPRAASSRRNSWLATGMFSRLQANCLTSGVEVPRRKRMTSAAAAEPSSSSQQTQNCRSDPPHSGHEYFRSDRSRSRRRRRCANSIRVSQRA